MSLILRKRFKFYLIKFILKFIFLGIETYENESYSKRNKNQIKINNEGT